MSEEAIVLVNAAGKILHANASASQWWQLAEGALVGDLFPNLFVFEVTSSDAEWLETQWQVIVDTAVAPEGLVLNAQPRRGNPFEVQVRLEKTSLGAESGFFAYVRKTADLPAQPGSGGPSSGGTVDAQTQSRFELLEQRSQVGFFDLDYAKNRFHFSSVWKNLLGFVDQDLPNTESTWRDLIHEEDSGAAPDPESERTPHLTVPFSTELRMRTKSGRYEWVQCSGAEVYGAAGRLERVVGTMLSIEERKEFEEACLASEERLNALAGQGEVAGFDFDFANERHWIAPSLCRMFEYRPNDLPASPTSFARLLPAEQAAAGMQSWFSARQAGTTIVTETTALLAKSGHPIAVQAVYVRTLDRRRNLLRVVGHLRPAASASAMGGTSAIPLPHLRAAFDRLSEGVIITDREGGITFANFRSAQLLGLPREQMEGRPSAELITLVNRLNNQPVASPISKVLSSGDSFTLNDEHSIPLERGLRRVVFACDPVKDQDDRTIGAVFVFRDPEEMTLTPDELVRSNRFESLGMLAGGIAHDFNNLLTTILGGISIAREARDYSQLEDSEKGCLAAKALTRQLLALARGGADLRQIHNPGEILRESVRLAAVGSPVKVELQLSEELHMIHADKAEIIRVFQNLVINSIQAMPNNSGSIWVRAFNTQLNEGDVPPLARGDYVHIEVQDNGSGIPAEHLQKIFEPFFTTKRTGTGLGLATVISIIKTHGGQVGVSSTVGVGTTFSIFLPRADQPVAEIQRVAPTLRFGTGRILVMDDEEKILQLVGIMLDNLGYKFDVARNGKDALALYQRYLNVDRPYDCVLLDLTIVGGMGGEETYLEMKRVHPDVCAVISSGYDSEEMMKRYLDMGFRGYLSKPYRVGELGKLLKRVLGAGPALSS